MSFRHLALIMASLCGLWGIRIIFSQSFRYGFVPLNIVLAAVPLILEPSFQLVRQWLTGWLLRGAQAVLASIWLLFLPNAFYILTDFMHLNSEVLVNVRNDNFHHGVSYARGDGLYLYDTLLLFCITIFGAYMGSLAILQAYRWLQRHNSRGVARIIIAIVILLSAIGVYIGRFSRWNSWQGLTHPLRILSDLVNDLGNSYRRERLFQVVATIILFECFSLYVVRQLRIVNGSALQPPRQ